MERFGSKSALNGNIIVDEKTVSYVRKKLIAWGSENFEKFPWRTSTNEFHTLIAEILLQRTKASQVISTYLDFTTKFPDPENLARAAVPEVQEVIQVLGLRWRAKLFVQLGKALEEYGYRVPDEKQALMNLPGVGAYISAAYLSLHRKKQGSIVDSNIVRFYGRFFGFDTGPETRRDRAVIELAIILTPARDSSKFNYVLIDFTRNICKPNPAHENCPVKTKCHLWMSSVHI